MAKNKKPKGKWLEPVTFSEFALAYDLTEEIFPHADFGLKIFKKLYVFFKNTLIFSVLSLALFGGRYFMTQKGADSGFLVFLNRLLGWLLTGCSIIALIFGILLLITWLIYFVSCVQRWRSFERHCVKSDYISMSLRQKILKAKAINSEIKERADVVKNEKENGKKAKASSIAALNAARQFKKYLVVRSNARQSLSNDRIFRYYYMSMPMPTKDNEYSEMQKLVENLQALGTNVSRGSAKFGSQLIPDDKSMVYYTDKVAIKDKFPEHVIEEGPATEFYEYTYPLSLFEDRTHEAKVIKVKARQWSRITATTLDTLLSTNKIQAQRNSDDSIFVSASTATIIYDLAFAGDVLSNIDKLTGQVDQLLSILGTTANIQEGKLHITIPLPKELNMPLNIPTMYREIFGIDEIAFTEENGQHVANKAKKKLKKKNRK